MTGQRMAGHTIEEYSAFGASRQRCGIRGDLKTDLADDTKPFERTLKFVKGAGLINRL